MGAARKRKDRILSDGRCIYCLATPTTIEHAPPVIMFRGKQRPAGLEFASCEDCNRGSKGADLVAAMLGRAQPAENERDSADLADIFRGVSNNIPGLLEEMVPDEGRRAFAARVLGSTSVLRVDGPLVSSYMRQFAIKMTFALYREVSGKPVSREQGVIARWYSNAEHQRGMVPSELFENLPSPASLGAKKSSTFDQFAYSYELSDDGKLAKIITSFRYAFLVAGFVAPLEMLSDAPSTVVRLGEMRTLVGAASGG